MARLAGVDLPRNKRMVIALTYIYGIGPSISKRILEACGISEDLRSDDLTEDDISKLRAELDNYQIEGDLRRTEAMNIKRLSEINSFRGMRHRRKLPAGVKEQKQTQELDVAKKQVQFQRKNN